jgi:hypothetical protein
MLRGVEINMTADKFCDVMRGMAEEVGIPYEQLMKLRYSQLQPIFEFARIKRDRRIARAQAERDRLQAEHDAWLNMHPLWRDRLTRKQKGETNGNGHYRKEPDQHGR